MTYREYSECNETIENLIFCSNMPTTIRRVGIVRVSIREQLNNVQKLFSKHELFPLTSHIEYNKRGIAGHSLKYLCWSPKFKIVRQGDPIPSYRVGKKEA